MHAYMPPCESLANTSSQPNPEILAAHEVIAHPHMMFHPYMCELHGGATAVWYGVDRL
jgi:hypothetical protein